MTVCDALTGSPRRRRIGRCAAACLLSTAFLLVSCDDAPPEFQEKPDPQVAAKMSLGEAKDIIQRGVRYYWSDGAPDHGTIALEFTAKRIEDFVYEQDGSRHTVLGCPYETFDPYASSEGQTFDLGRHKGDSYYNAFSADDDGDGCSRFGVTVPTREAANQVAAAFLRWKMSTLAERQAWPAEEQRRFSETAAAYRARNPRPAISEEIRRYKVVADVAVHEKRFSDAVDAYEDGLKLAPWWAEGQFNVALLLAELRYYDEAVGHMRKYLALEPQAANARLGQDRIYEWEAKAR